MRLDIRVPSHETQDHELLNKSQHLDSGSCYSGFRVTGSQRASLSRFGFSTLPRIIVINYIGRNGIVSKRN